MFRLYEESFKYTNSQDPLLDILPERAYGREKSVFFLKSSKVILIHCGSQNSKNGFQWPCRCVISSFLSVVGTCEYYDM